MKTAIVIGLGSDIARELTQRLGKDGWQIVGVYRQQCDLTDNEKIAATARLLSQPWDLLIIAAGTLNPVGSFLSSDADAWERSVRINALGPLRMLRALLASAREEATAVLFSGTNPLRRNPLYSAYSAAKAMLTRAAEEIDAEIAQKIVMLAPGFVATKIHKAHAVTRKDSTSHDDIYRCLVHVLTRPKSEVGGKKIHVPTWASVWREA